MTDPTKPNDKHKPPRKPRSAALIIREGRVLFIERHKHGKLVFFVLPGGSIKKGETPSQAAVREIKEELAVDITPGDVHHDQLQTDRETWIVRATLAPDQNPIWVEEHKQRPDNTYKAVWLDLAALPSLSLVPVGIYDILGVRPL